MRRVVPVAVLLSSVPAFGVAPAEAWPSFRGDPGQTGATLATLPPAPVLRWSVSLGKSLESSPAIVGGRVFVGTKDGRVVAVSLADGSIAWESKVGASVEAPVTVSDGVVFVGTVDGTVHALSASDGASRWQAEAADKILGGGVVIRSGDTTLVVFGSYDHALHAFDAKTGKPRWKRETGDYVHGTPAVFGTSLVVGGCDLKLHVVTGATGEETASVNVGGQVAGSVAVDGEDGFVGTYANKVLGLDLVQPAAFWTFKDLDFPFVASVALGPQLVYAGGRDRRLHALERETGKERWSLKLRARVEASPVLTGDGRVLVVPEDGRMQLVRGSDGKPTWTHALGAAVVATPAVVQDVFVVAAKDGRLVAFGAAPARARARR